MIPVINSNGISGGVCYFNGKFPIFSLFPFFFSVLALNLNIKSSEFLIENIKKIAWAVGSHLGIGFKQAHTHTHISW